MFRGEGGVPPPARPSPTFQGPSADDKKSRFHLQLRLTAVLPEKTDVAPAPQGPGHLEGDTGRASVLSKSTTQAGGGGGRTLICTPEVHAKPNDSLRPKNNMHP